jgi:hypothetical protein
MHVKLEPLASNLPPQKLTAVLRASYKGCTTSFPFGADRDWPYNAAMTRMTLPIVVESDADG